MAGQVFQLSHRVCAAEFLQHAKERSDILPFELSGAGHRQRFAGGIDGHLRVLAWRLLFQALRQPGNFTRVKRGLQHLGRHT